MFQGQQHEFGGHLRGQVPSTKGKYVMSPTHTWSGAVGADRPSSRFSATTAAGSATVVRERCGWVLKARRPFRRSQVRRA